MESRKPVQMQSPVMSHRTVGNAYPSPFWLLVFCAQLLLNQLHPIFIPLSLPNAFSPPPFPNPDPSKETSLVPRSPRLGPVSHALFLPAPPYHIIWRFSQTRRKSTAAATSKAENCQASFKVRLDASSPKTEAAFTLIFGLPPGGGH